MNRNILYGSEHLVIQIKETVNIPELNLFYPEVMVEGELYPARNFNIYGKANIKTLYDALTEYFET